MRDGERYGRDATYTQGTGTCASRSGRVRTPTR